ncbi:maleylacetoacetate isomerase [Herbaspirillum autotrophicum]|uniref:maleylacetoacetate isomerase n=1 Tax=Herbaspirillum autotrophicum TaxID=180195 RepID=UPI00067B5064|nr:maleylacetoacetate isomerase [Herbaspirillum autotrophicum]
MQARTLYGYFRSSASYRVRIALNLKQLDYETVSIHLNRHGGQQFSADFLALNPAALVPVLFDQPAADAGAGLTQSLAIIEYLDDIYPQSPLLPANPQDRAWVRSIALAISCDIHPLNNLRVLQYLVKELKLDEDQKNAWYRHWCGLGLAALEKQLSTDARVGKYCFGDTPTLADCCLVPQIFNAQRFNCDLTGVPTLMRIVENCQLLDAFSAAMPARQPDAE